LTNRLRFYFHNKVREKDEKQPGSLKSKRGGTINRDLAGFAFFLFISFVFWYLNFLGKDMESSVSYPVIYAKVPANRTLISQKTEHMNLSLKGTGFSIIKLKVKGTTDPLSIDLSKANYKRVNGSREMNYYILTSGLSRILALQLSSDCEIISVKPDTLFFTMGRTDANTGLPRPANGNGRRKM
jgi:hypothetical protein